MHRYSLSVLLALGLAQEPVRVLVYTAAFGFEHPVTKRPAADRPSLVESRLLAWAEEDPRFSVTLSRDAADFAGLDAYDALLLYTTGEIPLAAEQLCAYVQAGGGLVGVHSAADTLYQQPAYGELLGGYFDGHPWHQEVAVRVERRDHPATAHLEDYFTLTDEIYQFRSPYSRSRNQVLLSLDLGSVEADAPGVNRDDGDFALAWCRRAGRGRVFYSALGHREETWRDPRFRRHLVEGLLWAARRAPPRVDRVLLISVDGLRSDALVAGGESLANFRRLLREGAATLNARTDPDYTITLPNHAGMMTGRTALGPGGHRWRDNGDPEPGQTLHSERGAYLPSVFDAAHDHGLHTGLFAGKTKFSLFDLSWGAEQGADDTSGADDGRDKIDDFAVHQERGPLTEMALRSLKRGEQSLVFLHYADPDLAGHANGWKLDADSEYMAAVAGVDQELGRVFAAVEQEPELRGRTALVLTADHGGGVPLRNHHGVEGMWVNAIIPFAVWAEGVSGDLYALNAGQKEEPGLRLPPAHGPQPIRNLDAAELALELLGLPPLDPASAPPRLR